MIVSHYTFDAVPRAVRLPEVRSVAGLPKAASMTAIFVFLIVLLLPVAGARADASYTHLWGGFATSLVERSPEQRANAGRAAMDLDGVLIPPGVIFSFNARVGARDPMKGYLPAPIINDRGNLADIAGGGICQMATTIYNAALEAGMETVERHPHSRSVGYVPPGRDATILTWRKDLKLRNPHRIPLLLKVKLAGDRLTVAFWSVEEKDFRVTIHSDIIPLEPDTTVSGATINAGTVVQGGGRGFSVVTRRFVSRAGSVREELLSRDVYPAPSRILAGEGP
jgi:hypothetical protein